MEYDSPGNYTANIYLGGTSAPATLVSTQEFSATGTVDWKYVTLDTPVAIDGTQNLWITMYQAGITYPATACVNTGDPNGRWVSTNGTQWIDVTTAGDFNYTWLIRGFVTNQAKGGQNTELPAFHGEVGGELSSVQVTPVAPAFAPMNRANLVKYNVYRSNEATGNYVQIGEVAEAGQTLYEYFDTPDVAGMYYYQVTAVYDDGCESAPALAADDPTHNYVSASVDAIGENSDNVALYPNPTKGNVTIEANGMSRITVVSVLGQVVYDTELNADVYTLNMSQFNANLGGILLGAALFYYFCAHKIQDMTIKEIQDSIVEDFSMFDDWMDRYAMLIEMGKECPIIDDKYRDEAHLINGCQSRVWLNAELKDGKVYYSADSDAVITKGIVNLLIKVFSGQTPEDILAADLSFLDEIGLKEHLSPTRSNGLLAMLKQMLLYAEAFKLKEGQS